MEITKAPEAVGPADHFPYLGEHWIMMTSLRRDLQSAYVGGLGSGPLLS
jgi:hypothetical protein